MLESNLHYLQAAQASSFYFIFCDLEDAMPRQRSLLSSHFMWLTRHDATLEFTTLISYNFCDLQDTMPCLRSPRSFCNQSVPRKVEDFSRGDKYPKVASIPLS